MRVIAGEFRGRRLLPPEGETTRPITDRVKQSLFDILTPRLEGTVVWDLFAGTGSLGLESLSRGARQAVFFETNRSAVARLRRNIQALALPRDRAIVQPTDVFQWFRAWDKSARERQTTIPSPGTPGEGQGEGLLPPKAGALQTQNAPHPGHLPEYREREKRTARPQLPSPRRRQTSSFSTRPTVTWPISPRTCAGWATRLPASTCGPKASLSSGTTPTMPWSSPASPGTTNARTAG